MILTVLTLTRSRFTLNSVAPSDTILSIKYRLSRIVCVAVGVQRLIHIGKLLLHDEATVADCGINDGDFLILLIKNPESIAFVKRQKWIRQALVVHRTALLLLRDKDSPLCTLDVHGTLADVFEKIADD